MDSYDTVSMFLALLIVPLVIIQFFLDASLPSAVVKLFNIYYLLIYILFIFEFSARFFSSVSKKTYFKENWIEWVIILFPIVGFLSVTTIVEGVFLICMERVTRRLIKPHHYSILDVFVVVMIIVFLASRAILYLEKPFPHSPIKTISDAIWWAGIGVSTIGIGTIVPQSPGGKVLTLVLMLAGLVLFGVITAEITSIFTEKDVRRDLNKDVAAIEKDLLKVEKNVEHEVKADDKHIEDCVEQLEERIEELEKK